MKKTTKFALLSTCLLIAINTAGLGEPPPPPPPPPPLPSQEELSTITTLTQENKKLEGLYTNYKNALATFNLIKETPTKEQKQPLLDAAQKLGLSLHRIRTLALKLQTETAHAEDGELTKQEKTRIKKVDPKESKELINELEKALKGRKKEVKH